MQHQTSFVSADGVVLEVGSRVQAQHTKAEGGNDEWLHGHVGALLTGGFVTVVYDEGDTWNAKCEELYTKEPSVCDDASQVAAPQGRGEARGVPIGCASTACTTTPMGESATATPALGEASTEVEDVNGFPEVSAVAEPQGTLRDFLVQHRLPEFQSALQEQGVLTVGDLLWFNVVEVDDLAREVGMKIGHKSRFKGALQNLRSAQELRPPLGAAPRDAPPVAPPNVGAVGGMSCALLC